MGNVYQYMCEIVSQTLISFTWNLNRYERPTNSLRRALLIHEEYRWCTTYQVTESVFYSELGRLIGINLRLESL